MSVVLLDYIAYPWENYAWEEFTRKYRSRVFSVNNPTRPRLPHLVSRETIE